VSRLLPLVLVFLAGPALAAAPTAATNSATSVTATTAVFNGTANAGSEATVGWFRNSTTNPGTCNDTFGTRVPATSGTAIGSGTTNVAYSVSTTGLLPGTTYFFCAIVQNASGTAFGNVVSFTTPALVPTVFTAAATVVTSSSASLNGSATPNGAASTGYFRYSTFNPGSCFDSFGTRVPFSAGNSLGNGNASVNYSQPITGLLAGTTYFVCAFANNSQGTGAGVVLSFTTLVAAPVVTTSGVSSIGSTSASLSGTVNPNGASATGSFRISSSDPGTCNDAFGTRVPVSGGASMGSGTFASSYLLTASGLTPGTRYFFCAIGTNSEGTAFGAVQSFTTLAVPTVTSDAETSLAPSSVTLNGTGVANGSSTTGYFRYSIANPGACDDVFGARAPTVGGTSLGSGTTAVGFSASVFGLLPGTTYYFCAIANNPVGTSFGVVRSLTTPAASPFVSTFSPTLVTGTTATFNGQGTPRGAASTAFFRYSTTNPGICNDTFGTRVPATGGTSLGSSNTAQNFSEAVTGLARGTTYYVCALAQNPVGTGFGSPVAITTPNVPTVTTFSATSVGGSSASLNSQVNPNGAIATAYFRYSTSNPTVCNDTFGTRAPATSGTQVSFTQNVSQFVTALSPGTTYFYCGIATNAEGTGFGAVTSFVTPAVPTMVTNPVSALSATSTTLNGSGTPNNSPTTAYFRYDSSNPGTCSDTFGFRVPFSGAASLGGGTVAQAYSFPASLTPGQQYWYCAIGANSVGQGFGSVETFTAPATAPIVTTVSVGVLTATTAALNGQAVPRGAASSGYFRYSTVNPGTCNDSFGTRAPIAAGTSLGSGNTTQPFTENLTGLVSGATYFYCAIASNSVGTGFGSIFTFTTPAIPTVTTSAASSVSGTFAQLNATAVPNGSTTLGYFRYSVSDPGACNDTFGTRAPTVGGTNLGSGTTSIFFNASATPLTPGTTYYFCAIASNAVGTGFGAVLTFATPASPSVTTLPATSVTPTSGTLNATGIPNGLTSQGWFRYDTVNPGSCNDVFGTRAPASLGTSLGSGSSSAPFSITPATLLPGTTYYFCALASNTVGTSFGAVLSFTTPAQAPLVTSASSLGVTDTTATLNGSSTPRGDVTTAWFRYSATSPGACNDTFGTRAPATGGATIGSGNTAQSYSQSLTGLSPSTTYFWCAIAQNAVGTTFGTLVSFTTVALPGVTTQAASPVTQTTATLNGSTVPNGTSTSAWFRYSATDPGACNDTFGTRVPSSGGTPLGSGSLAVSHPQNVSGLLPGNQYFFCAIAQNAIGVRLGAVLTFTTPPNVPTVTTSQPTLTATTGTLNATANPNGSPTTGWFRYDTSNPGVCNDAFGVRAPATGGSSIPFGNSPVSYSQGITGLTSGTTYYVCAIAQNSVGLAFGSVLTVITPGLPTATTVVATGITSSGATLNGTGNPNRADATGYFRYSTTSPGTCNDTFGTRTPATGGSALGNATSAVSYSQAVTGLTNGTTYFFCAIAENVVGRGFGPVLSFTTLNAPTVVTQAATLVTASSATFNATANPNGATSTGWFRYSTLNPGTCNDVFGTRVPFTAVGLGSGSTPQPYSAAVTGLTAGTTYFVCAIASNNAGVSVGTPQTVVTPGPPTVTLDPVTTVGATSATFTATANPNTSATTGSFRYGTSFTSFCSDTYGTRLPASGGTSLGSGTTAQPFTESVTGLVPLTTYYVCAVAVNAVGTRFGVVQTFTTLAAPAVTTLAATNVTGTTATMNASINPRSSPTTAWFRYSSTSPGTCNDTFGTRVSLAGTSLGSGSTSLALAESLTGLTAGTTYYFCALAQNGQGLGLGNLLSFTTPTSPTVTTNAASAVLGSTATLNGAAVPNGAATTGFFRFSTTSPGTCNDTFGTRAPLVSGTTLGAGSSSVPFSAALTGLSSSTTYFVCAIAQNAEGTSFGAVQTFTTLAAPTVTTAAATSVTGNSATLNGSASPSGSAGLGWFRYSTVDPGTCSDTFGTRAPLSTSTSLGSGSSAVPYFVALAGLTPGTTYYFCALASNVVGTGVGAVQTFSTPGAPSVATLAATSVSSSGATLNGSADPRGSDTTGYFRFSTVSPGACNTTFGARAPVSLGTVVTAGSGLTPFSASLSGLSPATTYYFCAIGQNAVGTVTGSVLSFTTPTGPSVVTAAANAVTSTGATLNASANPLSEATTGWFRYGTTNPGSCNDTFGTRAPVTATSLGSGSAPVTYSTSITGLTPGTRYFFCAVAQSPSGTGLGSVQSFFTPTLPAVTTSAASVVTASSATLAGTANPNGDATVVWLRYGTTNPGTCNDTFGTRLPATGGTSLGAGTSAQSFTQPVTGLTGGTTYFFCAIGQNGLGTAFGSVLSLTTLSAPTVTTLAATSVTASTATLNGSGVAFGSATSGWFRYGSTAPGTCTDTFGTRAPATGGAALGNGNTPQSFSQSVTGLAPGATYFFCAITQNAIGTTAGTVLTFTTPAASPSVTTQAATLVGGTTATLNGTGTANGSATVGAFRYGTVNPGTCTDTYGTRSPATAGQSLGAGTTATPFAEALTGLMPGTTYFFCALASSTAGTTFGSVLSFRTPAAPLVTSTAPTAITATTATLNGAVTPNGAEAVVYFRYSTTNPGAACSDTFGARFPPTAGPTVAPAAINQPFSNAVTGLTGGTSYFFCAAATNVVGTSFGSVQTFTTPALPAVVTSSASDVGSAMPRLNGSARPNGAATTAWFRYSTTDPGTCNDTFGVRAPLSAGTVLGAGQVDVPFDQVLAGLLPGTTYFFCAIAQNFVGTAFGEVNAFNSFAPVPLTITSAATDVDGKGATLNGGANPNGTEATGWFRYSETKPSACDDRFGTRVPAMGGVALGKGSAVSPFSVAVTGLKPRAKVYFCAIASNLGGASFGELLDLTTQAAPPSVRTTGATVEADGSVTFAGSVNPNGSATTASFRYGTINPGVCNFGFGTRVPFEGLQVPEGYADVPQTQSATGLKPGAYYACLFASNTAGEGVGEVLSFTIAEATGCGCTTGLDGVGVTGLVGLLVLLSSRRRARG